MATSTGGWITGCLFFSCADQHVSTLPSAPYQRVDAVAHVNVP